MLTINLRHSLNHLHISSKLGCIFKCKKSSWFQLIFLFKNRFTSEFTEQIELAVFQVSPLLPHPELHLLLLQ